MMKANGFNLFPNTIMTAEVFEALPEIDPSPTALFVGERGKLYRSRIADGAWHVVCWAEVHGVPTAIASRVDTRIYRQED
jgi:hypothetical protein